MKIKLIHIGIMLNSQKGKNATVHLSKTMSFILRHGPQKGGPPLMPNGFLFVDDMLQLPQLRHFTVEDVKYVVETNDKQRFKLEVDEDTKRLKIRANQGHSVTVPELDLVSITNGEEIPVVVHGTSLTAWRSIELQGLSRMKRNHIHFAVGEPGVDGVISGMRSNSEVIIYINARKALADGLQFYRSANNVILCPGNENGILLRKYFDAVYRQSPRELIDMIYAYDPMLSDAEGLVNTIYRMAKLCENVP